MTATQIKRWVPAALWAALILLASSDMFSAVHTRSILESFFHWLFPSWSAYSVYKAHLVVRKCAHFFEYAILAMLVMRGFEINPTQGPSSRAARSLRMTMLGVVSLCAIVAIVDEVHQHFVPSRTGSPYDVLLDTAGSTVAMLLLTWRRSSPHAERKTA